MEIKIMKLLKRINIIETVMYLIFGFLTTIINLLLFMFFLSRGIDYKLGNLISIIISILFAYIVNKLFVFKSKCNNTIILFEEMFNFFLSRAITSMFDYFGLIVLISIFKVDVKFSKILVQIIVIVSNYILSKKLVYKK